MREGSTRKNKRLEKGISGLVAIKLISSQLLLICKVVLDCGDMKGVVGKKGGSQPPFFILKMFIAYLKAFSSSPSPFMES
jgi:hypothetical protein